MLKLIRKPKDFMSGALFLVIGIAGLVLLRSYQFGTARQMGPAFVPSVLSGLLAFFGLILFVRSLIGTIEDMDQVRFREPLLIIGGTLMFALLVRPAGLAIALPVMIITGMAASPRTSIPGVLLTLAALTIGSVLVFVYALGQPIPVLGYWFGS